jgi:2-dehydro-3-deoxygluconokinase
MLRLSVPKGERIETTHRYFVSIAGAEFNVAIALARMGRSAVWISRLPDSSLGRRVVGELERHGVDASHVTWAVGERLGTYFVELSSPPRPVEVTYDRQNSSASAMTSRAINWDVVEQASVLFVSGITPAISDGCRELTHEVVTRAAAMGAKVIVDINYRSRLWSPREAHDSLRPLCNLASLVILTRNDARTVFDATDEPCDALTGLIDVLGTSTVVMTLGSEGAAWIEGGSCQRAAAFETEIVDRVGAGDAFAAGVITGFLDGDLTEGVQRGLAMAALTLGLHGDIFVAGPRDVEAIRSGTAPEVER